MSFLVNNSRNSIYFCSQFIITLSLEIVKEIKVMLNGRVGVFIGSCGLGLEWRSHMKRDNNNKKMRTPISKSPRQPLLP